MASRKLKIKNRDGVVIEQYRTKTYRSDVHGASNAELRYADRQVHQIRKHRHGFHMSNPDYQTAHGIVTREMKSRGMKHRGGSGKVRVRR